MKKLAAALTIVLASTSANAQTVAARIDVVDEKYVLETALLDAAGNAGLCMAGSYAATFEATEIQTHQVETYAIGCWNYIEPDGLIAIAVHPMSGAKPYLVTYQPSKLKKAGGFSGWGRFSYAQ